MRRILCLLQLLVVTWTHPLFNHFEPVYPHTYPYSGYSGLNYGYNHAARLPIYNSYLPTYSDQLIQDYAIRHSNVPKVRPTMNVLAEIPYTMSEQFSIVPMFVVSKNSMKMVSQGHIVSVSEQQPEVNVKLNPNSSISCTPAVRMTLDKPVIVESLRSDILFPSEVQIIYEGLRIPIRIGAVIAPVLPNTYVSQESPIAVRVVYAVPTKPIKITITIEQDNSESQKMFAGSQNGQQGPTQPPVIIDERLPELPGESNQQHFPDGTLSQNRPQGFPAADGQLDFISNTPIVVINQNKDQDASQPVSGYPAAEDILPVQDVASEPPVNEGFGALASNPDYVNNADAVVVPNQEAVVVESESELPPKNITVINFPEKEAEPQLQVDEEDEELVNRNPPVFLAPAGIVQSTQPESHVEPFHNDKESPYLETLREQSNRKRI